MYDLRIIRTATWVNSHGVERPKKVFFNGVLRGVRKVAPSDGSGGIADKATAFYVVVDAFYVAYSINLP